MKIPIVICGALGRMGLTVIEQAKKSSHFKIQAGVISPQKKLPDVFDFPFFHSLDDALKNCTQISLPVVIDFSEAQHAHEHILCAHRYGCGFLLATTGHEERITALLGEVSLKIPVIFAKNTSLMANLMMSFVHQASRALDDAEISILDLHHKMKKDAPSGTAQALFDAIVQGKDRHVDIHSLRKGQVVGEHTVYFISEFERLEIVHRVADRSVFAQGALLAAQFLFEKNPGLYDMRDVLNLN